MVAETAGARMTVGREISPDPQHVCERQLTGCGGFLPHLLVCTPDRSLRAASARPFSTVSVHPAIARLIETRGL
jgi:hypothetical protein